VLEPAAVSSATTLGIALRAATSDLRRAGIENAGDDARRLMAGVLGLTPAQVLSQPEHPLSGDDAQRYGSCIARRMEREPVSRILGTRDFYGRSFAISPATLDPRPESETLVEAALELVRREAWLEKPLRILDVGTGSGCLLLTLLCELPGSSGVGTDVSEAALATAGCNAHRLGLERRVEWLLRDALDGVDGPFDMLVSNPPYVRSSEIAGLAPEVRLFDPRAALDGGSDGLRVFRRLAEGMAAVVPEGWTIVEVGHDQADAVAALAASRSGAPGGQVEFWKDVGGTRRCVAVRSRR
jgi:release factor glutamine methyltransferase